MPRLLAFCLGLASLAFLLAPGQALSSASGPDPVIAAAGDISCAQGPDGSSTCRDQATSDLLVNQGLSRVLGLGDQQYETGALSDFNSYYDATWGRVKEITSPSTGNHDPFLSGYWTYFGARVPAPYYSYDIGAWHLVSLDSNNVDAAQVAWLDSDLAANAGGKCVLAYWHHARFSSGTTHGNNTRVAPLWAELYDANAELVLSAHEHNYERFAPQDPIGTNDPVRGIRQFVVGTGGKSHYGFGTPQPNSEVRQTGTYGVLELTLRPGAYDWRFVPVAGESFSDSGTGICHNAADLSLTKAGSPDAVLSGELLTWTLTATNNGPSSTGGVTVTDSLPRGMRVRSARSDHGRCTQGRPRRIDCNLAELSNGETATVTIVARPMRAGTIVNAAKVRTSQALDPNPVDNTAIATTAVAR